jgi:hypothetical protein
MAAEPYGPANLRIVKKLPERALADMLIWLLHKSARDGDDPGDLDLHKTGPAIGWPLPAIGWPSLRSAIANNLLFRGTPASTTAIRKIREAFPSEMWMRLEKDSEELVRYSTWTPMSPSQFLELALSPRRPAQETTHPEEETEVKDGPSNAEPERHAPEPPTFERGFARRGDTWDLMFGGVRFTVKNTKGMGYIHLLLQYPDREFSALELRRASGDIMPGHESLEYIAELARRRNVGEPVLDEKALKEYWDAIKGFDREIAEAQNNLDKGRIEALQSSKSAVIDQLSRDTGLGGRSRRFSDDSERARKAVYGLIRTARRNIGLQNKEMAKHLKDRIGLGKSCKYRSDGTDWEL